MKLKYIQIVHGHKLDQNINFSLSTNIKDFLKDKSPKVKTFPVDDTMPPEIPSFVLILPNLKISISKVSIEYIVSFDNTKENIEKILEETINTILDIYNKYFNTVEYRWMGIVLSVNVPFNKKDNDETKIIFNKLLKPKIDNPLRTLNLHYSYRNEQFNTNIYLDTYNTYSIDTTTLKLESATKSDIIESGINFRIDVNNKPFTGKNSLPNDDTKEIKKQIMKLYENEPFIKLCKGDD